MIIDFEKSLQENCDKYNIDRSEIPHKFEYGTPIEWSKIIDSICILAIKASEKQK